MKKFIALVALVLVGCTTASTKMAIQDYQRSELQKQLAFNNAYRMANEQMLLNLTQYVHANSGNDAKVQSAIVSTWQARNQLDMTRSQFIYGRVLTMCTVGQYLYDQQGVLNVWFEGKADTFSTASDAAAAADKAAGVNTVTDLFKPTVVTPMPSTTQPASTQPSVGGDVDQLLRLIQSLKATK